MPLATLLPLAVFLILCRFFRHRGDSSREAVLRAGVAFVTILVAITEALSVPYLITRTSIIAAWSAVLIVATAILLRALKSPPTHIDAAEREIIHLPSHLAAIDIFLAGLIVLILALVGGIAIIAPPNTSDAMEYHLPRMILWVSNHTVRNFSTPDYAQLVQGPAAEFISLHAYVLFGSDRLVNLVEFFSLAGCAVAASAVAGKFHAERTGQLFAALFVVTLPEAILESSGAMNTIVVTFWIVTACYFTIRAVKDQTSIDVITAALACGLALLTKGIAFIYLPFVILGCILFRPAPRRTWVLKRLPLIMLVALTLNVPQFIRACQVTGTPLGAPFPEGGPRLHFGNDRINAGTILASVIRHATLHMETPSDKINARTESAVRGVIGLIGQNPDDPAAVWLGYPFYIGHPSRLETQAGNPLHFAALLVCLVAIAASYPRLRRSPSDRSLLWYTAGITCGFIAFCAMIRWQPWGSRFHLPVFVLAAAVIGLVADRLVQRRWIIAGLSIVLVLNALPYLLSNSIRSVLHTKNFPTLSLPRAELYFADQHLALAPEDLAMAAAIRASHCGNIAIDAYIPTPDNQIINSPPAFYIYPLLAQLDIDGAQRAVHYINVQNLTRKFSFNDPAAPCAIVCLDCISSHGRKSDTALGPTQTFGASQLTLPAPTD